MKIISAFAFAFVSGIAFFTSVFILPITGEPCTQVSSDDKGMNLTAVSTVTVEPISEPKYENAELSDEKKIIKFENIIQYPELPTGCEVTSLTMLLNHYGIAADKLTLADNYLPKQSFYIDEDTLYGADFRITFAGDPRTEDSYGCYAPCIVTTANKYLSEKGSEMKARDITGTTFDKLFSDYIDNGRPVLIWITSHELLPSYLSSAWITSEGESVQWRANEHCVVLTGYDIENGIIYVSDPMTGNTSYSIDLAEQRYSELGYQAVAIG